VGTVTPREQRLRERIDTLTQERDHARDAHDHARRKLHATQKTLRDARRQRDQWRARYQATARIREWNTRFFGKAAA
jgi:phage shock protein A